MESMYADTKHETWDKNLPFVTFAYNTTKQGITGHTPFFLLYGLEDEKMLDIILPYSPDGANDDYMAMMITRAEE